MRGMTGDISLRMQQGFVRLDAGVEGGGEGMVQRGQVKSGGGGG